ncbi:hypothetical protein H6F88_00715 [Oculatella sp. FACHB-28]|uniref:hypothetical protein n=1 Tax=Cyanophyceae TaxID=3028117 RepID=UPI0016877FB8|nr:MULTISPECIES: hypothetical protein [Cyanophyceae]MBD1995109.1 hypothetical protein [Leptolyngbya sp. FACHB-541]MBD2054564.1 hypothetical protein [Oculatella sp. FACHB-28]
MSPNLREKAQQSVETLLTDLSVDSFELHVTRDFWDSYDENDFLSAYQEVEQYYRESITYVSEILGCNGTIVKCSENNFPNWLHVNEACFWYLDGRTFVLYWKHEDKELPVIVWLYAFDPNSSSHRLLDCEVENQFSCGIYYDSEENRIRMLDADDTSTEVRNIIFNCFCAFPSKGIAEALIRNRDKDYGSFTSEEVYVKILQKQKKINKLGDAYPLTPNEFKYFEGLDEVGIITLLNSPETSPALRTRAALKVWQQPSLAKVKALEQGKDRTFDRHVIEDIGSFISEAKQRLQRMR